MDNLRTHFLLDDICEYWVAVTGNGTGVADLGAVKGGCEVRRDTSKTVCSLLAFQILAFPMHRVEMTMEVGHCDRVC